MEHSLLHGIQLVGLVVAGGTFWFALLARWVRLDLEGAGSERLARQRGRQAAWAASAAAFADLFVQVAEIEGRTIFGGVPLPLFASFVTTTAVGQLGLGRCAALLVLGLALLSSRLSGWVIAFGSYLVSAVLTASVSHAAAQPTGAFTAVGLHLLHLVALSAWIGVIFHFWLQRQFWLAPAQHSSWALLLGRFSALALAGSICALGTGVISAVQYVQSIWDLLFSAYGISLVLKLFLVAAMVGAGAFNFLIAVPHLKRAREERSPELWCVAAKRFQRSLEFEVTAALLAIAVAGIVASVSPPGNDRSVTLTGEQVSALLTPKLPPAAFVDPQLFVGDSERNRFDLLYSEFMHNWSGVGVILMGCFWLLQGGQGRVAEVATRLWPVTFIPFALFISIFADPEVFLLRSVTWREALSDPVVLEHQFGALLVLLFVWLGWRDRYRIPLHRPLGPTLPLLMILGSLLLLGHAHASVRSTQELTNLINVQHAVFGLLGLVAGTTRWFMLRQLLPLRVARFVWPSAVILLGVLMTFFYRESV